MDQKRKLYRTRERYREENPDHAYHFLLGYLVQLRMMTNDVLDRDTAGRGNRESLHHHQVTFTRLPPSVLRITSMVRGLERM